MKKIIISSIVISALLTAPGAYAADVFTVRPKDSSVTFKVSQMGIALVRGQFKKFSGTITFGGGQLTKFEGIVDMTTLATGIAARDKDLKSKNFFATDQFPVMRIESGPITQNGRKVTVKSALTIRNVTKTVELVGTVARDAAPDRKTELMLKGNIDRKDFGLRLNKIFEFFVGNQVGINLKLVGT